MYRLNFLLILCVSVSTASAQSLSTSDVKTADARAISKTHEFLKKYDGEWDGKVIMFQPDGDIAVEFTGIASSDMIMGDRYQVTTLTADILGQPMQGMSMLAFDTTTQEFVNTWIDNFGTGMLILQGIWNVQNPKQIDFTGNMIEPVTGEEIFVRQEYLFVDQNTQMMRLWYDQGEGEYEAMHVVYTRK